MTGEIRGISDPDKTGSISVSQCASINREILPGDVGGTIADQELSHCTEITRFVRLIGTGLTGIGSAIGARIQVIAVISAVTVICAVDMWCFAAVFSIFIFLPTSIVSAAVI